MDKKVLLKCENAAFNYGGATVLSDVSLEIYEGDYLCLLGQNGTGKSTLMEGLLGLKSPDCGKIELCEGLRRDQIGYLPQFKSLDRNFPASCLEIVLSGTRGGFFYTATDRQKAKEVLETVGMSAHKRCPFSSLSGGQRQRVLLARALLSAEKVLLLDEPMTALDRETGELIYKTLAKLHKEGLTVVAVSHDQEILNHATRVMYIDHRPLFCGSRDEFLNSEFARKEDER